MARRPLAAAAAATPNLDAPAREGVRFEAATSPAPLTLPGHATLFTGRVPRRHGVRDNDGFRLRDGLPVLADLFRGHGYRTAAFVSAAVLDRIAGLDRGFEPHDDDVRVGPREAFNREERAAVRTSDAALAHLARLEPKRGEVEAAQRAFVRSLGLGPTATGPLEALALTPPDDPAREELRRRIAELEAPRRE